MIEPIRPEHTRQVVGKLRDEPDLTLAYIRSVVEQSLLSQAGTKDGAVVILFGVQTDTLFAEEAYMWMLSTAKIEDHKIEFLRLSRAWVRALPFKKIHCMVYFENIKSIRWLEWMGFAKARSGEYNGRGVHVMELSLWQ